MGKQNRRRANKPDKKDKKRQQLQQQSAAVAAPEIATALNDETTTIKHGGKWGTLSGLYSELHDEVFVGDRGGFEAAVVATPDGYRVADFGGTKIKKALYRCVVAEVRRGELTVVPLDDGSWTTSGGAQVTIRREEFCRVIHDQQLHQHNVTTRFDVGDGVVFKVKQGSGGSIWVKGVVPSVYPERFTPYYCTQGRFSKGGSRPFFSFRVDTDQAIKHHPSSFRFSRGASVRFSTSKAKGLSDIGSSLSRESWLVGVVVAVDVEGMSDFYAAYKVRFFQNGSPQTCYILEDDDAHIADPTATPRQRLLDAIEQDLRPEHLDYIVESFEIDVDCIQCLLVTAAIRSASYFGLIWLTRMQFVDLKTFQDEQGNGPLYLICTSPNSERFFRIASEYALAYYHLSGADRRKEGGKLFFHPAGFYDINRQNKDGILWLDVLIKQGNTRTLDYVLSPERGYILALHDLLYEYEPGETIFTACLRNSVDLVEGTALAIVRAAFEFSLLDGLHSAAGGYHRVKDPKDYYETKLRIIDELEKIHGLRSIAARRFLRHLCTYAEYYDHNYLPGPFQTMSQLCLLGWDSVLRWLAQADDQILRDKGWTQPRYYYKYQTNVAIELVQVEFAKADPSIACLGEDLSLVECAAHGLCILPPTVDELSVLTYNEILHRYLTDSKRGETLVSFLKSCLPMKNCGFLGIKIMELEDDIMLDRRLKVLDFLLREVDQRPPDVLKCVRWRQCGVLRWLVAEGFVDLWSLAAAQKEFAQEAGKLRFLGGRPIPGYMSTSSFLCFAAIEFDDLQTLLWLLDDAAAAQLDELECYGWNAAHAAAFFGRVEIVVSLAKREKWRSLNRKRSVRDYFTDDGDLAVHPTPAKGLTDDTNFLMSSRSPLPVHLAVKNGFTVVAEILLSSGAPVVDDFGISLSRRSERSTHDHVRPWGEKRITPFLALQDDVTHLYELLTTSSRSAPAVRQHITSTSVFDPDRWALCGLNSRSEVGPDAETYADIVAACLRATESEFVDWLLGRLWPGTESEYSKIQSFFRQEASSQECLETLAYDKLVVFAASCEDKSLSRWVTRPWANQIECKDPQDSSPPLADIARRAVADLQVTETARLLLIELLKALRIAAERETLALFARGDAPEETLDAILDISKKLALEQDRDIDAYYQDGGIVSSSGVIDLKCEVVVELNPSNHPDCDEACTCCSKSPLYELIATKGYCKLYNFCRARGSELNPEQSFQMLRIASRQGDTELFDAIHKDAARDAANPGHAVLLGLIEAGKVDALRNESAAKHLSQEPELDTAMAYLKSDPPASVKNAIRNSSVRASIWGYINGNSSVEQHLAVVKLVASKTSADSAHFLASVKSSVLELSDLRCFSRLKSLMQILVKDLGVERLEMHRWTSSISISLVGRSCPYVFAKWLGVLTDIGVNIQDLKSSSESTKWDKVLETAQKDQLRTWSQFTVLKNMEPLATFKEAVENRSLDLSTRDKSGLFATHIAAAFDRVDVLKWLVSEKGMSLHAQDYSGRKPIQVAKSTFATNAIEWIAEHQAAELIAAFLTIRCKQGSARRQRRKVMRSIMLLQARYRGIMVRLKYKKDLEYRREQSKQLRRKWGSVICVLSKGQEYFGVSRSWSQMKGQQLNFIRPPDDGIEAETSKRLDRAAATALEENIPPYLEEDTVDDDTNKKAEEDDHSNDAVNAPRFATDVNIHFTANVANWLTRHPNYRFFFVRRIQQLQAGERSRILAKRLRAKSVIFETYLEQKSGHRILWTNRGEGERGILIWYIAKHKEVSRLVRLIDDALNRSRRQLTDAANLPELQDRTKADKRDKVLLDPHGNTPLKLYEVRFDQLRELEHDEWTPRLNLTEEEREIVQAPGTVLVLGRSGTGKTLCICNRLEYDRQRYAGEHSFSQLFVARSHALRQYVRGAVGEDAATTFSTFRELVLSLEARLPPAPSESVVFSREKRMDFRRFKQECFGSGDVVDALTVWTSIRSFIKGSIEALKEPGGILPKSSYEEFGRRRCRLSLHQRLSAYESFERYHRYMKANKLWDDCDRVALLLRKIKDARARGLACVEPIQYSKGYVDEIQDYNQAELLLFFQLCGLDNLFLAGDPAQSVIEGAEFRFEDVRSVAYSLCDPSRQKQGVLTKPKTVAVNFRSHSGILNTAAAVLRLLFEAFPDTSAKQLKGDRGLFQGPRPASFQGISQGLLQQLVRKLDGVVVLTHDANVRGWKKRLDYPLVYGIREAKGLEFRVVILLDFFGSVPMPCQKPWRELLLARDTTDFSRRHVEIEGHLKLLYTAITRCINRLYFAESSDSTSGDAFVRWLTTAPNSKEGPLGLKGSVDKVEKMTMTPDEWALTGFENAVVAEESTDDLAKMLTFLEKAKYCFDQIGEKEFSGKVEAHKASIRFRLSIENNAVQDEVEDDVEMRAARLMENLLSEMLLLEARHLWEAVAPLLPAYAKEYLQRHLVPLLPESIE